MKKLISFFLVSVLFLSAGCGQEDTAAELPTFTTPGTVQTAPPEATAALEEVRKLSFAGQPEDEGWFRLLSGNQLGFADVNTGFYREPDGKLVYTGEKLMTEEYHYKELVNFFSNGKLPVQIEYQYPEERIEGWCKVRMPDAGGGATENPVYYCKDTEIERMKDFDEYKSFFSENVKYMTVVFEDGSYLMNIYGMSGYRLIYYFDAFDNFISIIPIQRGAPNIGGLLIGAYKYDITDSGLDEIFLLFSKNLVDIGLSPTPRPVFGEIPDNASISAYNSFDKEYIENTSLTFCIVMHSSNFSYRFYDAVETVNAADNGSNVHGYLAENPFYSVDKLNEYIQKTEEAHYVSPFRAKAH